MSWTDERVALLKRLWGEGKTAAEIAKLIGGVTRNAVIGKAHRLKLSGRVSPIQENGEGSAVQRAPRKPSETRTARAPKVTSRDIIAPIVMPRIEPDFCVGEGVQLVELREGMCRWPVGDPKEEGFKFCGGTAAEGMTYCEHHCRLAYQVNTRSKLRIDDLAKIDADVLRRKVSSS
jgi:GcrA cell cycle regulator